MNWIPWGLEGRALRHRKLDETFRQDSPGENGGKQKRCRAALSGVTRSDRHVSLLGMVTETPAQDRRSVNPAHGSPGRSTRPGWIRIGTGMFTRQAEEIAALKKTPAAKPRDAPAPRSRRPACRLGRRTHRRPGIGNSPCRMRQAGPFIHPPGRRRGPAASRIVAFVAIGGATWAEIRDHAGVPDPVVTGLLAALVRSGQLVRRPDRGRACFCLLPGQEPGERADHPNGGQLAGTAEQNVVHGSAGALA